MTVKYKMLRTSLFLFVIWIFKMASITGAWLVDRLTGGENEFRNNLAVPAPKKGNSGRDVVQRRDKTQTIIILDQTNVH